MFMGKNVEVTAPIIGSYPKWFFISRILLNLCAASFNDNFVYELENLAINKLSSKMKYKMMKMTR